MKIKSSALCSLFFLSVFSACQNKTDNKAIPLFDGKTFNGWEGDTVKTWKISDGTITGGSLTDTVPENNFLCTTKPYSNFDLKLKFKLSGTEGFINSGVQFHSVRATNPPNEMIGYQADLGDAYWGGLYDETRRDKTLAILDSAKADGLVKKGDWNDYEVRTESGHTTIFINGEKTVDYTEPDKSIPQSGTIGLQIHGGGKAEVHFKDIFIEELP